jgi:hypothetical protein
MVIFRPFPRWKTSVPPESTHSRTQGHQSSVRDSESEKQREEEVVGHLWNNARQFYEGGADELTKVVIVYEAAREPRVVGRKVGALDGGVDAVVELHNRVVRPEILTDLLSAYYFARVF